MTLAPVLCRYALGAAVPRWVRRKNMRGIMSIVAQIEGGTVTFKKNQYGTSGRDPGNVDVGLTRIRPADEYWFDYWFFAIDPWVDGLGGKLPGLAGGKATSGGADVVPDGWSSRIMWGDRLGLREYRYSQDRENRWGDSYPWNQSNFEANRWNRVTQYLKINTPGNADGAVKFWFNGKAMWEDQSVRWRGDVDKDVARVDRVRMSIFRGGGDQNWAVPRTTRMEFSDFYVMDCMPDFSVGSHDTPPVCKEEAQPERVATIQLEPGTMARMDGDVIILER